MREFVSGTSFLAIGSFAAGISHDVWQTLATIGAILAGWLWFESRIDKMIDRKLELHTVKEQRYFETRLNKFLGHSDMEETG